MVICAPNATSMPSEKRPGKQTRCSVLTESSTERTQASAVSVLASVLVSSEDGAPSPLASRVMLLIESPSLSRARRGSSSSGAAVRTISRAEATLSVRAATQRQCTTCGASPALPCSLTIAPNASRSESWPMPWAQCSSSLSARPSSGKASTSIGSRCVFCVERWGLSACERRTASCSSLVTIEASASSTSRRRGSGGNSG
mmetsp:Transcript_9235/g.18829  ORF Transcript_9235/g.18829 Transcript_9235/m.18829 type:complete len:201 (-) Transcript_9235:624-1226(-)